MSAALLSAMFHLDPRTRSRLLRLALAILIALAISAVTNVATAAPAVTADDALGLLAQGNQRYVAGQVTHPDQAMARRAEVAGSQAPFAVVLGCADSRVAPEIVFDQGLGDLFVIRVAGNVLDNTGLGSIEYAVEHLHSSLIVVLGHERCGAVTAAVKGGEAPGHIHSIVQAIEPAVEACQGQPGDPVENAVRANVSRVVTQLRHAGPLLAELVEAGKVKVVGARYDLDTGVVEFLP